MVSTRRTSSQSSDTGFLSDGEGSVKSDSTTASGRQKLPKWIQKQLAEDIEEAGGLHIFDAGKTQGLADLLDYRAVQLGEEEVYGLRGSRLRARVRSKVNKWKGLTEIKYWAVLADLKVLPATTRKKKGKSKEAKESSLKTPNRRAKKSKKDFSPIPEDSSPGESKPPVKSISVTDTDTNVESLGFQSPSPASSRRSVNQATEFAPLNETVRSSNRKEDKSNMNDPRPIQLDPNLPGDQGEGVSCFRILPNHEKDGVSYTAIQLELDVHPRDVEKGNVWIDYRENSDELVLYKPRMTQPYMDDKVEHDARQANAGVKMGHDAARSAYSKLSEEKKSRKIVIKLPKGFKLTQKPFGVPTADNEAMETAKSEIITYKKDTDHTDSANETIYVIVARLTWAFCDNGSATTLTVTERGGKKSVADSFGGLTLRETRAPMDAASTNATSTWAFPSVPPPFVLPTPAPSAKPSPRAVAPRKAASPAQPPTRSRLVAGAASLANSFSSILPSGGAKKNDVEEYRKKNFKATTEPRTEERKQINDTRARKKRDKKVKANRKTDDTAAMEAKIDGLTSEINQDIQERHDVLEGGGRESVFWPLNTTVAS